MTNTTPTPRKKRNVNRLTIFQQGVLVAFVEDPDNYALLYNHRDTKGISNDQAFDAMAKFFVRELSKNPREIGNVDLSKVDSAFAAMKWKQIMASYSNKISCKTGNGLHGGTATLKPSPFKDRLDAFANNPKYDSLETRDVGMPGKKRALNVTARPARRASKTLSARGVPEAIPVTFPKIPVRKPALPEHLIHDMHDLCDEYESEEDEADSDDGAAESVTQRVNHSSHRMDDRDPVVLEGEPLPSYSQSALQSDPPGVIPRRGQTAESIRDAEMKTATVKSMRSQVSVEQSAKALLEERQKREARYLEHEEKKAMLMKEKMQQKLDLERERLRVEREKIDLGHAQLKQAERRLELEFELRKQEASNASANTNALLSTLAELVKKK
ncbi:hypothetical protein EMPS_07348 [Entomortierella parvispora]|uniref:Uncharacterized protein n=1 Tax=Entomortierella parvispora TaxID=205924 RepID=A0A9P3HEC8_9FUNG|nr:hypothetical protein EMPS_07348 [Entomortierella parvispora]